MKLKAGVLGGGGGSVPNTADSVHAASLVFCLICMTAREDYRMKSSGVSG